MLPALGATPCSISHVFARECASSQGLGENFVAHMAFSNRLNFSICSPRTHHCRSRAGLVHVVGLCIAPVYRRGPSEVFSQSRALTTGFHCVVGVRLCAPAVGPSQPGVAGPLTCPINWESLLCGNWQHSRPMACSNLVAFDVSFCCFIFCGMSLWDLSHQCLTRMGVTCYCLVVEEV